MTNSLFTYVYSRRQAQKLGRVLFRRKMFLPGRVIEAALLPSTEALFLTRSGGIYSLHLVGADPLLPFATIMEHVSEDDAPFIVAAYANFLVSGTKIDFEGRASRLRRHTRLLAKSL